MLTGAAEWRSSNHGDIVKGGRNDKQLGDNNLFSGTVRIPASIVHKPESVAQLEGKVCIMLGEFTWLALH